ncbi:MAG: hypothetical protein JNL70_09795 [Saprospiraceae bacterium]|nr:hypothetical protein [Saprospiraceae bacterium]
MKSDTKPPKDSNFMKGVKNTDRVLRLAGRIFIILLIVWILWAFRKAYRNDSYTFEPFSVPPSLVERGYAGEVIVDKIILEMNAILSKNYFDEQSPEAYRKIVAQPALSFSSSSRAGYFDLESLFKLGKVALGKTDKIIKGHITRDDNALNLALHLSDKTTSTLNMHSQSDLDSLIHGAALFLIRQTNPQFLVYYYLNKQDFEAAQTLLDEINFKLNNNTQNPAYAYERIQWGISMSNLKLAQQDFEGALAVIENLQKSFPQDLATDVQKVNILMSQVLQLENAKSPPSVYRPIAQRATQLAAQIDKHPKGSLFLDKQKAMGWLYANWAYLEQKIDLNAPNILSKYQKAIDILPNAAFAYNNLSYYYMDKKNYKEAEETLKKALFAEPKDGNTLDTYAEIMSLTGDTTRFYLYLERALQNPNPTEGITADLYALDKRWDNFKHQSRFQNLIKKYKPQK